MTPTAPAGSRTAAARRGTAAALFAATLLLGAPVAAQQPAPTPPASGAPAPQAVAAPTPPAPPPAPGSFGAGAPVPMDPRAVADLALREPAQRFGAVLRYYGGVDRTHRYAGAGLLLGVGATYALAGGLILTNSAMASDPLNSQFAVLLIGFGAAQALAGGLTFLVPTTYERWSREYERDLQLNRSPSGALARGLRRWEEEVERFRIVQRAVGVLAMVVGGTALGVGGYVLTSTRPSSSSFPQFETIGGSMLMLLGALDVGLGITMFFITSPLEQALRAFRLGAGLDAPSLAPSLSVAPVPGGGAMGMHWRF